MQAICINISQGFAELISLTAMTSTLTNLIDGLEWNILYQQTVLINGNRKMCNMIYDIPPFYSQQTLLLLTYLPLKHSPPNPLYNQPYTRRGGGGGGHFIY